MAERNGQPWPTILLVDGERTFLDSASQFLEANGFGVSCASDGLDALAIARTRRPDMIVLNLDLPGLSGLNVCRSLRMESAVPIILVSDRSDEATRVEGLEAGADDYVTKPVSLREVSARVRAVLRRSVGDPQRRSEATVRLGDLEIDHRCRTVKQADREVMLKPKEFDLLHYLASHAGRALTRRQLMERVWGYDASVESRTLDVHVRWLREKLETDPASPELLVTVRGVGYMCAAPPRLHNGHRRGQVPSGPAGQST